MNTQRNIYFSKTLKLVLAVLLFSWGEWQTVHAQVANVAIDIPAPFGGEWGILSGGVVVQSRTRNFDKGLIPDGNAAMSLGLGNSKKWLGVMVNANIYGLSNDVGEENNFGLGGLDVQLNRNINDYLFVGVGARNLVKWRAKGKYPVTNRSFFLTSSYIVPIHREYDKPFSLLFITAGIGNGMFRPDKYFDPTISGRMSVFGSVALQVFRGGNAIVEWSGYELSTGLSVYPFKKIPTLGGIISITDLTEERPRFIASAGYSINLNKKKSIPSLEGLVLN